MSAALAPRRRDALWLAVPGVLFLVAFLVGPALGLLSLSFTDGDTGAFSLAAYRRAFGVGVYTRIIGSTFMIALQTMGFCLLLGYPLAYWLAGLPARRRRMATLLVLLPFWTSALVKNFAWLVLLGRTGIVAGTLQALGVEAPPDLLFNRGVVLFAMTHSLLPLAVISMLSVMTGIDERLRPAAGTLGASRVVAFWRVYMPLSMPGVASAGLLVFIAALGYFITPALLGSPRETMMGNAIIIQVQQMDNMVFAAALSAVLIAAALLTCVVYDAIFGLSGMSGGGGAVRRSPHGLVRRLGLGLSRVLAAVFGGLAEGAARLLGGHRLGWLLPAYACAMVVVLVVPVLSMVPMAFTSSNFMSFPPPGFSLRWFEEYATSPVWVSATLRSFGIGIATAFVTVTLATLAALGLARSGSRLSGAAFLMFMTPMVVPSIVVAVSLFQLFAKIGLVATDLGIMIGHTVHAMPIAFVILLATLKGHDLRLDQAAATLGANRPRTFLRVTMPLIRGGLVGALIFAFLASFEELTVAMFIGGGLRSTLPKQMWDDVNLQVSPVLVAASVVVVVIVTVLFLLGEYLRPGRR
ncbi:putative spermidine/putrescine transport system permease protein [Humitalea rosea]|uniref:Putative spermidine/putrescine transport system permease protein n=1 Tax=Humitalea rosea TaxID=990373 RepID=A0A2W7I9C9_9PROT|nr:ABC transporter permease subunit [Humitalea rosea]PZW42979.1 putative spermidine/putrescine transport system permease protein [Humitalea rosea]